MFVTGNNLFYNFLLKTDCLAAPEQSFPFCPLVCLITFGIRLFQNFNSFALYFCFSLGFTSRARQDRFTLENSGHVTGESEPLGCLKTEQNQKMRSLMITKILQSCTKKKKKKKKKNYKMVGALFPAGLHFLKRKSARSFAVCHLKTKRSDEYLYILMHGFCVNQCLQPIKPDHG